MSWSSKSAHSRNLHSAFKTRRQASHRLAGLGLLSRQSTRAFGRRRVLSIAQLELVSQSLPELRSTTGNSGSRDSVVSGDGRYVAFASESTDLVTQYISAAATTNVFRFDRLTGAVELVSDAYYHVTSGDGPSIALISAATVTSSFFGVWRKTWSAVLIASAIVTSIFTPGTCRRASPRC